MNISIPKISKKTVVLPALGQVAKGLLLIVLTRCEFFGMWPLGTAFAAAFFSQNWYIALLGLCFKVVNSGMGSVRYILTFFTYNIFLRSKKIRTAAKRAVALGIITALFSFTQLLFTGFNTKSALLFGAEAVLCGGLFYILTFFDGKSAMSNFARIVVLGSVLSGISGAVLPYANISIQAFCAIFSALSVAYACELPTAALASGLLAFVMSAGSADAVRFSGAFGICASLASVLSGYGKMGVSTGFLCGACVCVLYGGSMDSASVFDILAPLVAFMVLPERIHYKISGLINKRFYAELEEIPSEESRIAVQLKTVAGAVCGLADGVNQPGGDDGICKEDIFEKVKIRVCRDCSLNNACKKKKDDSMSEIWQTMEECGYCDLSNMPVKFGQTCIRAERFLTEFGHIYELYKQNTISKGAAKSSREIIARQYGEISNVIELLSREIEAADAKFDESEKRFSPKITIRTEAKPGGGVSGDTVTYFERENKFFVILCDGMGSGRDAMRQSRLAARLFEKFLKAGFNKETSLRMINSALALKADQESFSTADILEIDTKTGECEFLKVGSAQSFIKRKKEIEVVSGKSLPVGILENISAEPIKYKAEVGDVILMVSDGISEAENGVLKSDWIKKLLLLEKRKVGEIADLIIVGAKARAKVADDITCCIIKIEKRKEG